MKKIMMIITCLLVFLTPNIVKAENDEITVYIFYGNGCPHCHAAFEFFDSIEEEYGKYFKLEKFETWGNKRNNKLMKQIYDKLGPSDQKLGVPYIIIGEDTFLGYSESFDDEIIKAIVDNYNSDTYEDVAKPYVEQAKKDTYMFYGTLYGSIGVLCGTLILNEVVRSLQARKKK